MVMNVFMNVFILINMEIRDDIYDILANEQYPDNPILGITS